MKKKLIITLVAVCTLVLMFGTISALATRQTELPVVLTDTYGQLGVDEFYVWDVEAYPAYNTLRVYIDAYYDTDYYGYYNVDLVVHCYDLYGGFLKTVSITRDTEFIDVPYGTAMLELASGDTSVYSDSYFYVYYQNVYAPDGRVAYITDIQVPVYENVGWAQGVYLYALDGRTIEVSPYKVSEYTSVGWYTWEAYCYHYAAAEAQEYASVGDYESAITIIDIYSWDVEGTEYEYPMAVLKATYMDTWRNKTKCPIGIADYQVDTDVYPPQAVIGLRNISYKDITDIELSFDVYNQYGYYISSGYDRFIITDDYLASGVYNQYYWDLDRSTNAYSIENIKVWEITYSDGTKWYR